MGNTVLLYKRRLIISFVSVLYLLRSERLPIARSFPLVQRDACSARIPVFIALYRPTHVNCYTIRSHNFIFLNCDKRNNLEIQDLIRSINKNEIFI